MTSRTALHGLTIHTPLVPALLCIATHHLPKATTHRDSARGYTAAAARDWVAGDEDEAVNSALMAIYLSAGGDHPDYDHAHKLARMHGRVAA